MVTRKSNIPSHLTMKPPSEPLEDREICALIDRRLHTCLNNDDGELSEVRERSLSLYRGDAVGIESDDRSKYRTREIFEMVEDALPALTAIFFSTKAPIQFKPRGRADVHAARVETNIINYYLFGRTDAFMTLHTLLKDALLNPVAYCKVHCVEREETFHHKYEDISAQRLVSLRGDPTAGRVWKENTVEIKEITEHGHPNPRFSFEGTEVINAPEFRIDPVPPEEMLISKESERVNLDETLQDYGFICHRTSMARSELIKMGFNPEEISYTGTDAKTKFNDERTQRRNREDEGPQEAEGADWSTTPLTVHDCYFQADLEADGVADTWHVVKAGDTILLKEKVSYQPFVAVSAIPMPHKHAGLSTAEVMEPIQLLKTKLTRIALDDLYRNEERRVYISKSAFTPRTKRQIMDREAGYVEVNGVPGQQIYTEPPTTILEGVLATLQYADDLQKRRSGMAPDVALNPDVLRDATAHGMLMSSEKTSGRLMHIGRMLAEQGFKVIGQKLHWLLRTHQDTRTFLEIDDEWVESNPPTWFERGEMYVAAGLGFNSKVQLMQALTQILALQKEAMGQGMAKPEHIFHTLELLVRSGDMGFAEQYFVNPRKEKLEPPPPPPDPQIEAVKMQEKVTQLQEATKRYEADLQREIAAEKADLEEQKHQVDRGRVAADAAYKSAQAESEALLLPEQRGAEIDKMAAEIDLLREQLDKVRAEAAAIRAGKDENDEEGQRKSEASQ